MTQQEVNRAAPRPQASTTVGEFWVNHFKPNVVDKMKPNTRDMYMLLWKNLIAPVFERERMRDINGLHIDRFLSNKYKQGYASQTVLHLRSVLSKMFKTAIKWRWLVDNPAREIDAPPTRVKRQQRALSVEEVSLLFEHQKNPARLIVMIGVMMGLRIGEILGFQAGNLDWVSSMSGVRGVGATRAGRRMERIGRSRFLNSWGRHCETIADSGRRPAGSLWANTESR